MKCPETEQQLRNRSIFCKLSCTEGTPEAARQAQAASQGEGRSLGRAKSTAQFGREDVLHSM